MALDKCLLCKSEDLSPDTSFYIKKLGVTVHSSGNPSPG